MADPSASPSVPRVRASTLCRTLALATVMVAGCGPTGTLPPAGAQGPIVVRQWARDGREPVALVANTVRQVDPHDLRGAMELEPVLLRVPHERGVVFLAASRAMYGAGLGGVKPASGRVLPVEFAPPVHVSGVLDGEPLAGVAQQVRIEPSSQQLELRQVELVHRGGWLRAPVAVVAHESRHVSTPEGQEIVNAHPALTAALAALPRPLVFPELTEAALAPVNATP